MLKITITDINGKTISKEHFLSLRFSSSADTPCDALDVVFDGALEKCEYKSIKMFYNDAVMFDGVVDVQTVEYGENGVTSRIQARSNAAFLVDNACIPCTYNKPSSTDLYEKHVKKYGLANRLPMLAGEYGLDVSIGDSDWSVINKFIKSVSSLHLRVNAQNELTTVESASGKKICFSNDIQGSVHFSIAKVCIKRAGVVSKVTYKIDSQNNYIYHCDCKEMKDKGINTVRCVNLAELEDYRRGERVKSIIRNSMKNHFAVTLNLPYVLQAPIGTKADFCDRKIGSYDDMIVYSVDIKADGTGAKSVIVLKQLNDFTEEIYVD